jgi:ADP-ribosylglycohydrolase
MTPWTANKDEAGQYFEAGGNGAAMRMLPHVLWHARADSMSAMAQDAVQDTIATHGHPRAIVGAVVYAVAGHVLINHREPLRFGALIDAMFDCRDVWTRAPDLPDEWLRRHPSGADGFIALWERTAEEMRGALEVVASAIREGLLADDRNTLSRLGALGRAGGAGTTTAASAIYLASRYAGEPRAGVMGAATTAGADTDTLAAMTGGLLGCALGTDWMPREWLDVQDADVLRTMARRLVQHQASDAWTEVTLQDLDSISQNVGVERAAIRLGADFDGRVVEQRRQEQKNGALVVSKVLLPDGQSIFLRQLVREENRADDKSHETGKKPRASLKEIVIFSPNVARLAHFYRHALGMHASAETRERVSFGPLTIVQGESMPAPNRTSPTLVLAARDWDGGALAEELGARLVEQSVGPKEWKAVWQDPEGNLFAIIL